MYSVMSLTRDSHVFGHCALNGIWVCSSIMLSGGRKTAMLCDDMPSGGKPVSAPVFDCRMCGCCCEGKGGIVVSPTDMPRLCAFLSLDEATFLQRYGVMHNGKPKVRTGEDGNCIFFARGRGCTVHEAKPDICRAWPFFRGNMVDPASLRMAKEFCPGIRPDVGYAAFVAEGGRYLNEQGLVAHDPSCEAHALMPLTLPTR